MEQRVDNFIYSYFISSPSSSYTIFIGNQKKSNKIFGVIIQDSHEFKSKQDLLL